MIDIFYFGSVINDKMFDGIVKSSKRKPSSSAQVFEMNILKGLNSTKKCNLTVCSAESIAIFPESKRLFIKSRNDLLFDDIYTSVLPSINLPFIKSIIFAFFLKNRFKKWAKKNIQNKILLTYGQYTHPTNVLLKSCRKYNIKSIDILADSPSLALSDEKSTIFSWIKNFNRRFNERLQGRFDYYVILTEFFKKFINGKKSIILECICDAKDFFIKENRQRNDNLVFYAGTLNKKYGINNICKAFLIEENKDLRFCIAGSGDCEDELKEMSKRDSRIIFLGRLSREDILELEQECFLLINLRDPNEYYTRFSFPSKMVEYMASGTPVLTTKLSGIPNEYFEYVFTIDQLSPIAIFKRIKEISAINSNKLIRFGKRAREFVLKNKTYQKQGQRLVCFMEEALSENSHH